MQILVPWLHMMSFSAWLGVNVLFLSILWPSSRSLPAVERARTLCRAGRALNAAVTVAAPLTVLSGLGGLWLTGYPTAASGGSLTLVMKTLLAAAMIVNHILQAFRYRPSLDHPPDGRDPWTRLLVVNVILGVLILLLGLL